MELLCDCFRDNKLFMSVIKNLKLAFDVLFHRNLLYRSTYAYKINKAIIDIAQIRTRGKQFGRFTSVFKNLATIPFGPTWLTSHLN